MEILRSNKITRKKTNKRKNSKRRIFYKNKKLGELRINSSS